MTVRERVALLIEAFQETYPGAHCELDFKNVAGSWDFIAKSNRGGTPDAAGGRGIAAAVSWRE